MDLCSVIFGIIFFLVILAAIYFGHLEAEKRRKALREWAMQRGFRFRPDKDRALDKRFPLFACLKRGRSRYGHNFIEGDLQNRRLCAFDYHFTTGSGKNRRTHHLSVVVLEVDLRLRPLFIRTENFFDKFNAFLGFDDINFESAEFNRKFHVTAPNRRWAFDVLHQEAIEFLLHAPVFNLEFQDRYVIAYRDKTFSVADFERALEVAGGLLDLLPKSVLRELKGAN